MVYNRNMRGEYRMKKRKEASPTFLVVMSIVFGLCIILQSFQVLNANHIIVKIVNLISVIFLSSFIGAFIREIFIMKQEKKSM